MKASLADLGPGELDGRRALVRVDFNVPLESGRVADPRRIRSAYPTLDHLLEAGARPVLCSHLGRPGGRPEEALSLEPVARFLADDLGAPVAFRGPANSPEAVEDSRTLEDGEILVVENTRFLPGETTNDPGLSEELARLGDLFVNDAFAACHRAHASVVGVTGYLRPAVAGLLVRREVEMLDAVRRSPGVPLVLVVGGAKIADKLPVLEAFLDRADAFLVGGAMANTFLAARGHDMAASRLEEDLLDVAAGFMDRAGDRLHLPTDVVVARELEASEGRTVPVDGLPDGTAALDIGPETREAFGRLAEESRTLFWNGPMGVFEREPFAAGTRSMARAVAGATRQGGLTVVGGGDSARALHELEAEAGVTHVSTGGGAALTYLAEGSLPGIDALDGP